MMISSFARESGLSVDTVRFYVRRGLLHPEFGEKGGARPYQMFSLLDVEKARIIRAGQAPGLSLEEIGSFLKTRTFDGAEDDHLLAFLAGQREQLTKRVAELQKLISFVDAKMAWLRDPTAELRRRFPGDRSGDARFLPVRAGVVLSGLHRPLPRTLGAARTGQPAASPGIATPNA